MGLCSFQQMSVPCRPRSPQGRRQPGLHSSPGCRCTNWRALFCPAPGPQDGGHGEGHVPGPQDGGHGGGHAPGPQGGGHGGGHIPGPQGGGHGEGHVPGPQGGRHGGGHVSGPQGGGHGGAGGGQASSTFSSLFLSSIWFCATTSNREATLLFTSSTSCGPAQGFAPGRVPKMYWSFSPSALMIWLRASSSIAMEAMIIVSASSRVRSAPLGGKEGIDISAFSIAPPQPQARAESYGMVFRAAVPSYAGGAVPFRPEPTGRKAHRMRWAPRRGDPLPLRAIPACR